MAESLVQVTEGSGKKLHTISRTVGANTVEDEVVLLGEQDAAAYMIATGSGISAATASSHLLQIMAGGSLRVYIRRLIVYQVAMATTAGTSDVLFLRLTTAGTGGTALTTAVLDPADGAGGATGMSLPTVKGTEGTAVWRGQVYFNQTLPTAMTTPYGLQLLDLDFDKMRVKPPVIAAGTTNGFALKNISAITGATVTVIAYISERAY